MPVTSPALLDTYDFARPRYWYLDWRTNHRNRILKKNKHSLL